MGAGPAEDPENLRAFVPLNLALVVDLIDVASDLSADAEFPPAGPVEEALGLSDLSFPGIFERIEFRMDRDESFVSERLNEGYCSKPGSLDDVLAPSPLFLSFEGWLPMVWIGMKSWQVIGLSVADR